MASVRRSSLCATIGLLALASCETTTQTSSGRDYLAARPDWMAAQPGPAPATGGPASVDRAVFEAARAEPDLRFPARFGLARVEAGRLTAIPPEEADAWLALVRDRGAGLGEFAPISPLVTEMTVAAYGASAAKGVVDRIRIGAARQHVDAVLVYEVGGRSRDRATPLSVLDLTLIGLYLVPSRSVGGEAVASALLVDVRNGYPYGTATARAEEGGIWTSSGSTARSRDHMEAAKTEAVRRLTGEVGTMVTRLKTELEARELAQLRSERDGVAKRTR